MPGLVRRSPSLSRSCSTLARLLPALLGLALAGCPAPAPLPPAPKEDAAVVLARTKAAQAAEHMKRKDSDAALELALEAFELRRRALGEASAETEASLQQLGDIYFSRGQLDVAEKVLRRALDVRTILVGADDPALAEVLDRLFIVLDRRGDLDAAIEVAARSVALREAAGDPPRYELGVALLNLGSLYLRTCRVDDAAPRITRALQIAEATLPVGSPLFARFFDAMADVHRYQGRPNDALPLFEREERLLLVRDAVEAERMASVLRRELAIHYDRGSLEQRSAVIARSLVLAERWFPPKAPVFLELALPLAALFNAAGNRPKAVMLYQRLHVVERVFPIPTDTTTTRLDPPTFRIGVEPIAPTGPSRNVCVPEGKEALSGAAQVLAEQRPRLRACYETLPKGHAPQPFDAHLVLMLDPQGGVATKVGALTFDDVPDALADCVLAKIAEARFPVPFAGAERVVLPLHLAPDGG